MKKFLTIIAVSAITFVSGYALSEYLNSLKRKTELESTSTLQLALQLEALKKFEEKNFTEAKFMMQASSVGHFEALVASAEFADSSKNKFRCTLLKRYANYYLSNQLFEGKEWEEMLAIESISKEAQIRKNFFKVKLPMLCPEK